jgi:hypothetical protein
VRREAWQAALNIEALGGAVDLEGTLDIRADLNVHLVFGVDADGFFLDPDSNSEPEVSVSNLQIGGKVQGSGRFGFLEVKLTNATLNVDPQVKVAINLHDPGTGAADGLIRLDEFGSPTAQLASVQLQGNPSADDVALTGAFAVAALIPGQTPCSPSARLASPDLGRRHQSRQRPPQCRGGEQRRAALVNFLNVSTEDLINGLTALADRLDAAAGQG